MAFVDTLMMPQIDPRSVNGGPSMHLNSRFAWFIDLHFCGEEETYIL